MVFRQVGAAVVFCLASLLVASSSWAGVTFYVNDSSGFASAVSAQSLVSAGTEDFEESTLAANSVGTLDDPLAPGVANSVFLSGTLTAKVPGTAERC